MKHCGLLGEKLGHSYSPQIHAMLADYPYELFEREEGELADFLDAHVVGGVSHGRVILSGCCPLPP